MNSVLEQVEVCSQWEVLAEIFSSNEASALPLLKMNCWMQDGDIKILGNRRAFSGPHDTN